MRVLVVSEVSSFMPGGVPAETRRLIRGLAERGHDVAFAGDSPISEFAKFFAITLPIGSSPETELRTAVSDFTPDIVHVIALSSPGVARARAAFGSVPWVLTCHSLPPYERKIGHFHGSEALHYAARAARFLPNTLMWRALLILRAIPHVIVHSDFVRQIVIGYGYQKSRVSLIPFGIDVADERPALFRPAGSAARLLTVAGLAHTKGQHDVILALPAIARRSGRLRYCLVGETRDETYRTYLLRLAASLPSEIEVDFRGGVTNAERDDLLASADLYVQPSHEEGFCLAFAEAAHRVPRLLGTNTGAIAAICEGDEFARVVPPRSPTELAKAASELLEHTPRTGDVLMRANRLQSTMSWPTYVSAHEELYLRLIALRRAA